jgi:hypothetical protein
MYFSKKYAIKLCVVICRIMKKVSKVVDKTGKDGKGWKVVNTKAKPAAAAKIEAKSKSPAKVVSSWSNHRRVLTVKPPMEEDEEIEEVEVEEIYPESYHDSDEDSYILQGEDGAIIALYDRASGLCTRHSCLTMCEQTIGLQNYLAGKWKYPESCKFFGLGACHSGEACLFIHDDSETSHHADVVVNVRGGKSDTIVFQNAKERHVVMTQGFKAAKSGFNAKPRTCLYWLSDKGCSKEAECDFIHLKHA